MQTDDIKKESYKEKLERVQSLFTRNSEGRLNRNLFIVSQCVGAASLAGFVIGGRIGARVGAVEHIENSTLAVYASNAHAQRQYHGRVVLGFVKNGSKFGWRAGVFAGLYSLLLVTFNEASKKTNDSSSFLLAGALTGIIYKSLSGWRSMVVGAILGTGLSIPPAAFTAAVNQFATDDVKEKLSIFYSDDDASDVAQGPRDAVDGVDRSSELDQLIDGLSKSVESEK